MGVRLRVSGLRRDGKGQEILRASVWVYGPEVETTGSEPVKSTPKLGPIQSGPCQLCPNHHHHRDGQPRKCS